MQFRELMATPTRPIGFTPKLGEDKQIVAFLSDRAARWCAGRRATTRGEYTLGGAGGASGGVEVVSGRSRLE